MAMRIEPLGNRVLVRRDTEKPNPGGLTLPDSVKEKPVRGTVIAVGPGRRENGVLIDVTVKAGDRVTFGKYAGSEYEANAEKLVLMSEDEIVGRLHDEDSEELSKEEPSELFSALKKAIGKTPKKKGQGK